MQHAICDIAKKYRFAIRHIKNKRDSYTDATRYRNIAATHIACDTEEMLHREISHGNFIIFDAFLGRFWLFSTSDCVMRFTLRKRALELHLVWITRFSFQFLGGKNFLEKIACCMLRRCKIPPLRISWFIFLRH